MNTSTKGTLVTLLGVAYIICALPVLLGALAVLVFAISGVVASGVSGNELYFGLAGVGFGMLLMAVSGFALMISGVGLLARMAWARIVSMVLAVLMLIVVPIGTVVGVAALVILLQEDVRREFIANVHA